MPLKSLLTLLIIFTATVSLADIYQFSQEVDKVVHNKLKSINQDPRQKIDDHTFCRRVYLDAIGRIPTIDEYQAFINDKGKNKRARLIDKLIGSKGHHSHMYNYWADLLRVKSTGDRLHYAGNFSEWIKDSVRKNKPYDQFVRELVNAGGHLYKPGNGAAGFQAREPMQLDRLANTIKTFLGVSIECAQCHDHPFDDWTQKQFYEMAAFTSQVHLRVDPPADKEKKHYGQIRRELKKENFDKWIVYRESLRMKYAFVYGNGTGYMRLPHDYQYDDGKPFDVMQAQVLFGSQPTMNFKVKKPQLQKVKNKKNIGPPINAKQNMADWMTSRDNPMFTKATVNRLWHWVMGSELIGPITNLDLGDEGPHPELTAKLVEIMKKLNYDTESFFKVLLNTRIYQSQALPLREQKPAYLLDGPLVRRLSAEAMWDSLLSLKIPDPDKFIPTEFQYDGFTHFYEKSQSWTAEDFKRYSRECGHTRAKFYQVMHKEAQKRNSPTGPNNLGRASEAQFRTGHGNKHYDEVGKLFGASTREIIDSASQEPNIPQILYMMNGKPEDDIIAQQSYLNKKLTKIKHEDKAEFIWQAILSRPLHKSEKALLGKMKMNQQDIKNLMWALINSNEFRFTR